MRRIYDSDALRRDDEDPFSPRERSSDDRPQSMRSVPSTWISRRVLPGWLRDRAVSVRIETASDSMPIRSAVPFRVHIRNRLPVPVTMRTLSSLFWEWSVDGLDQASEYPTQPGDPEGDSFTLSRGQRLKFDREWNGMFQVAEDEWEWAEPGEYTLSVRINVENATGRGLADETTIRLEP